MTDFLCVSKESHFWNPYICYCLIAGTVMFEYGMRLGREVRTIRGLEKQGNCYLAAINCLRLIRPEYAWIVQPASGAVVWKLCILEFGDHLTYFVWSFKNTSFCFISFKTSTRIFVNLICFCSDSFVLCYYPFGFQVQNYCRNKYCCLGAKSCRTLCDPMDCGMPGFPVLYYLPELAQTHVHRIGDVIQSSHPLSSPSPPTVNLSQHQWVSSLCQVAKVLELQLQHQSFHWIFRIDFL